TKCKDILEIMHNTYPKLELITTIFTEMKMHFANRQCRNTSPDDLLLLKLLAFSLALIPRSKSVSVAERCNQCGHILSLTCGYMLMHRYGTTDISTALN